MTEEQEVQMLMWHSVIERLWMTIRQPNQHSFGYKMLLRGEMHTYGVALGTMKDSLAEANQDYYALRAFNREAYFLALDIKRHTLEDNKDLFDSSAIRGDHDQSRMFVIEKAQHEADTALLRWLLDKSVTYLE